MTLNNWFCGFDWVSKNGKKSLSSELIREEEEKKGLKAGIHQCAGLIPNNKVFRDKILLFLLHFENIIEPTEADSSHLTKFIASLISPGGFSYAGIIGKEFFSSDQSLF